MKYVLLSLTFLASLVPFGSAQRAPLSLRQSGQPRTNLTGQTENLKTLTPNSAPSYCKPCLAYGGDFDPNDPDANGLPNWNIPFLGEAEVWVPFIVPKGKSATVTGMFVNTLASAPTLDPATTPWAIQARIKPKTPGTIIASGTATATITATGRSGFGFNEYTVQLKLKKPVTLKGDGKTAYWFNLVPQCTTHNFDCETQFFYESDAEGTRANHGGLAEPADLSYFNSSYFGFVYTNTSEVCARLGCNRFSAGLTGTLH